MKKIDYQENKICRATRVLLKRKLKNKKNFSAVYFLIKDNKVVYVGQTKQLKRRLGEHINQGIKDFDDFTFVRHEIDELLKAEREMIIKYNPLYNGGIFRKSTSGQVKKKMINIKISNYDKNLIALASKKSGISMSEIMRIGTLREAKKILRDIEKGK